MIVAISLAGLILAFLLLEIGIKHRMIRLILQLVLVMGGLIAALSGGVRIGDDLARNDVSRELDYVLDDLIASCKTNAIQETHRRLEILKSQLPLAIAKERSMNSLRQALEAAPMHP